MGSLAASVPVAAIWSPLAIIGAVPLVAWAGLRSLHGRKLRWTDIAIAFAALVLALPALAYLAADAQQVPSGLRSVRPLSLAAFLLLEVAPFLWIACRLAGTRRFGADTVIVAAAMLAILPFFHVGDGADLVMRASIAPRAVLAGATIAGLIQTDWRTHRATVAIAALLLSLGAVTGAAELARARRYAPAPQPPSPLPQVWHRQTGWVADISTYLARIEAMPAFVRPQAPGLVDGRTANANCWSRPWKTPR